MYINCLGHKNLSKWQLIIIVNFIISVHILLCYYNEWIIGGTFFTDVLYTVLSCQIFYDFWTIDSALEPENEKNDTVFIKK